MDPHFYAATRQQWRAWLKKNHARAKEVWLIFYKRDANKSSVSYQESLEEALCFGWIDGLKKRIDNERYTHRFSPRKVKSKWTETNIKLAKKLINEGKMMPAGLATFEQRSAYSKEITEVRKAKEVALPAELERALKKNKKAWNNFTQLAPGYRKNYVLWLTTAKKPETRDKRLKEAITLLANNEKLGMR